jgi:hypothetical protein
VHDQWVQQCDQFAATQQRVEQPVYDEAHAAFGAQGITDMLSLIGAYQTVCGVLNAVEIPAPQTSQASYHPPAPPQAP